MQQQYGHVEATFANTCQQYNHNSILQCLYFFFSAKQAVLLWGEITLSVKEGGLFVLQNIPALSPTKYGAVHIRVSQKNTFFEFRFGGRITGANGCPE